MVGYMCGVASSEGSGLSHLRSGWENMLFCYNGALNTCAVSVHHLYLDLQ